VLEYSQKFFKPAPPSLSESGKTSLFVKGFQDLHWTHADLHAAFEKFGRIESAKVSIDKDHVCRGYGFVRFKTHEEAKAAIEEVWKQRSIYRCTEKRWEKAHCMSSSTRRR